MSKYSLIKKKLITTILSLLFHHLFNYHYQDKGYYPLFVFDWLTGDLMKAELWGTYISLVATMEELVPYQVLQFYYSRGKIENFIKERKNNFDFFAVSSSTLIINANRMQVHMLAYNLINWFRRLALAANMRKMCIDTIPLKLMKVTTKMVRSAWYKYFKLHSNCPYKKEFHETLANIQRLQPQLC